MKTFIFLILILFTVSLLHAQEKKEITGSYYLLSGQVEKDENGIYSFHPQKIFFDDKITIIAYENGIFTLRYNYENIFYVLYNYKDNVYFIYPESGSIEKRYIWIENNYIYISVFPSMYDNNIYDESTMERMKNNSYLKIKDNTSF